MNQVPFLPKILRACQRLANLSKQMLSPGSSLQQDDLDIVRRTLDPRENSETEPPPAESIDLHCMWVGELYTAAQLQALERSLDKLGWLQADGVGRRGDDLARWLEDVAQSMTGGGSRNLGMITRPGDKRFLGTGLHAPLPVVVDYAMGSIHYIGPGLVGIVLQFVLNDAGAKRLENDLRVVRATYAVRRPHSVTYVGPRNQKSESSRHVLRSLRDECAAWFRDHIPGFFSQLSSSLPFPTSEFLTFQEAKPFVRGTQPWGGYLHVLRMDNDFEVWESPELPGVKLGYVREDTGIPTALVLAAQNSEFFGDRDDSDWESHGGRSRFGYANRLRYFDSTFAVWTVHAFIGRLERECAKFRNALAEVDLGKPDRAARELARHQRNLLELSRSMVPAAGMLRQRVGDDRWFRGIEYDFVPTHAARSREPPLFKSIREELAARAEGLLGQEQDLIRIAGSQTSLVYAQTQNRANKTLVGLTWALVGLTVAIASLTVILVVRP